MSFSRQYRTYIIEPNRRLATPYIHLPDAYRITTFPTIHQALQKIRTTPPDLVLLSASWSYVKSIEVLESLKDLSLQRLIPVIFVVDWRERLPRLVGTNWGHKIGLLHSFSSEEEVTATLDRVMRQ